MKATTEATPATTRKLRPVEKHLIDTRGFFYAKVEMYAQDYRGYKSDRILTYEGYVLEDGGIIWMIRPEANMRSNWRVSILTVSERLISIEKVSA